MARILVVDDSESVFFFVRKELREEEHIVERLAAFTELATYMRSSPPDLILLDLEMPALSGRAFGQFLRRIERGHTKILIHSSLPVAELKRAATEVNAVGTLEKTADGRKLRAAVRACLNVSLTESQPKILGTR